MQIVVCQQPFLDDVVYFKFMSLVFCCISNAVSSTGDISDPVLGINLLRLETDKDICKSISFSYVLTISLIFACLIGFTFFFSVY
jgi:hypothetical protein